MKNKFLAVAMGLALFSILFVVPTTRAAVDLISIWTLSPDPASVNSDLTTNIAFSVNDSDTTHEFCIEGPVAAGDSDTNWHGTMPASISLTGSQGFSSEVVSFNKATLATSQATCAGGDTDAYVALYSGTSTLATSTNTSYTTSTGSTIDLDAGGNVASAHTGNWRLVIASAVGAPDSLTFSLELTAAATTIYASDSLTCFGLGAPGTSCFQELDTAEEAADAAGADTLVIVGDLTVDASSETATIDADLTTIRGSSDGTIIATNCSAQTILNITKSTVDVSDLEINGTACTGAATGISATGTATNMSNVEIHGFGSGTGVSYSGSGAGTVTDSSISNNNVGINDSTSGTVNIGTDSSDGNTLSDNTTGLNSNGGLNAKGNAISGGTTGVNLTANPTAMFGNSVTGASGNQINCGGTATLGAGFNFLGGFTPTSGSNCTDVTNQLGAAIFSWTEGTSNGDVSIAGASGTTAVFQLMDDPYTYGEGLSDLTGFYAVMSSNNDGTVTHSGSGGTQHKMNMDASGCSPMTTSCWESAADGADLLPGAEPDILRVQNGSGYYALGNLDPLAITMKSASANGSQAANGMVLAFMILLTLSSAALLNKNKITPEM